MLVLNVLRQNGFRRMESLLTSPDNLRATIVQRMQTRKSSALLAEFRAMSEWQEDWPEPPAPTSSKLPHSLTLTPEAAEVSDDTSFLKRTDTLWKVGALVSAAGGIENAVTNAVNIGSVMNRCPVTKPLTRLLQGKLIRAFSQIAFQIDITFSDSSVYIKV